MIKFGKSHGKEIIKDRYGRLVTYYKNGQFHGPRFRVLRGKILWKDNYYHGKLHGYSFLKCISQGNVIDVNEFEENYYHGQYHSWQIDRDDTNRILCRQLFFRGYGIIEIPPKYCVKLTMLASLMFVLVTIMHRVQSK